jgi:acyl carrier protein
MNELNHQLSKGASVPERLLALVRQTLGQPAASRPLPIDARLSDLGFSSIKLVNLILAMEAEFDIMISQSDITPANFDSIAAIQTLVSRLASARNAEDFSLT